MTVHIEKDGDVTIVTLNRPDVRNAVDSEHARALHEAFLAFDADGGAKVAVFHGAHGHFCAGWDLQFGARMQGEAQGAGPDMLAALDFQAEDSQPLGPMGPSRLLLSKPVNAAVSGHAVAGGLELALMCDLRVAARSAVAQGLIPAEAEFVNADLHEAQSLAHLRDPVGPVGAGGRVAAQTGVGGGLRRGGGRRHGAGPVVRHAGDGR